MVPGESILGYEIVEYINEGAFCRAYKAKKGTRFYFVKIYFPFGSNGETQEFKRNQDRIASLLKDYPYCEKIIETTIHKDQVVQVKNYINGKDLEGILEGVSSAKSLLEYAIKLATNVLELHNRGIIHSDLKPKQFMVDAADNQLHIIDLDWSFPVGQKIKTVGTVLYKSPEHYERKEITFGSDVFSTGIVLYETLTRGGHPFLEEGVTCDDETIKNVMKSRKRARSLNEAAPFWSKELSEVLNRTLSLEPHLRPSMKEVVKALEEEEARLFSKVPVSMILTEEKSGSFCYIDKDITFDRNQAKVFFQGLKDDEGDSLHAYWNKDGTPMFRIFKEPRTGWYIEDVLGSNNWVQLNGTKLCGKSKLKKGDKISLIYRKTGKGVADFFIDV
ncbi:MAG TPA: protein kinase [Thermotogota bacterium]|nr:protein kinase [Thermotogota bacterium]